MSNKLLTLDHLYSFFVEQNKSVNFSSKKFGNPIVVSVPGNFDEAENDMPGMLGLKLKVCHTLLNRNGSFISEQNMKNAMPTLKYRPILAYIHELPDGNKDFFAHNVEFTEDENGDTQVVYLEKQVGCFTAEDPWLEYDAEMDKTYVVAYAVIPEEYTETADIIRRKNGTKVSCELVINELAYNAKEKYLDLTDFYFGATTLLGCDENGNEISEGMLGARADITDFCHKEPVFEPQDKLIETLEKLNNTLSSFNKNTEEGGDEKMDNVENIVVEEELEATTEEDVAEETETIEETHSEEETTVEETSTSEENDESAEEEKFTKNFAVELSHGDIQYALYNLIGQYEEEDNDWYYIRDVYDNYFYMQGWFTNKIYKLGYSVDGENVALEGDRQEMFELIVSESEKMAVEKMREDYASLEAKYNELKSFKDQYDADQVKAEKDAVFASAEYDEIRESDEFKHLVNESEKYAVDELKVKADLLFAASMKKKFSFEAKPEKKNSVSMNFNAEPDKKKQAYGGLFAND